MTLVEIFKFVEALSDSDLEAFRQAVAKERHVREQQARAAAASR